MLLIFITCYVIDFIFHEYYSNILWVLHIDMNIDICKKTKTKINYSEIKIKIKKLHAHNVRQSLPYTYRLCLEIEKKLAYSTF